MSTRSRLTAAQAEAQHQRRLNAGLQRRDITASRLRKSQDSDQTV